MNIKVHDDGERIQTFSNLQGRVVSKDGIMVDEDYDDEEDEEDYSQSQS